MTDSHCHVSCGDPSVREFLIGRDFIGIHPWETLPQAGTDPQKILIGRDFIGIHPWETLPQAGTDPKKINTVLGEMRVTLENDPNLGIGEIGLDRLRERDISSHMREVFEKQLKLAIEFHRPVVLHGAKSWGQVVSTIHSVIRSFSHSVIPSFLFHGFSRSDGLIPDIVALNGYMSVGPAILNDHAVNYRELAKKIPSDRLLVETDRTEESAATCPSVGDVLAKLAEIRGVPVAELEAITDRNADDFLRSLL